MADAWGLDAPKKSAPKRPLKPEHARAGHQSIVWVHATAIGIWLFTALILGGLWLAGKNVPGAIVIAGLLAACGHGVFVGAHLYLARVAQRRAALAVQTAELPATDAASEPTASPEVQK